MRYILIVLLFNLSSCWAFRAYKVRRLQLTDHQKLPAVCIARADQPFSFHTATDRTKYALLEAHVDSVISGTETAAFLVIRNDSILYEKYSMGFDANSVLPANSMTKSFTGTLVGIALFENKIKSDSDPITHYLPELKQRDHRFRNITIRNLLDMRSGLDFDEYPYNLRSDAVKLGFGRNLEKHLLKARIAEPPGRFRYQSINTQLLGLIIQRATGKKLQDYFREKLWNPIGAEHDATWNVDSRRKKHVITSAGLNATARDFAKLGRLYIKQGWTNGYQVVSTNWLNSVISVDSMEMYQGYKNHWWSRKLSEQYSDSLQAEESSAHLRYSSILKQQTGYVLNYRPEAFSASGFMNQIIYVHPKKNIIIVRLGRSWPRRQSFTRTMYALGENL